ncbi:MAG TPA: hypothetical protein VFK76_05175 [Gaiellaceae bacterium]|nr:hypothetical protein [Gaiellaceae bacterium]
MSIAADGRRVGKPAPFRLVACYFATALASWIVAMLVVTAAAPQLAAAEATAPRVLLSVHLVALGFLPLAVTGAAFHVLPTLLRNGVSTIRGWAALPLLCAGPFLALGIANDRSSLIWPAATAETAGFVVVAWELMAMVVRAPRGRMLLASRAGVLLSTFHAAAALAFGAALAAREWRPILGIPHDRAIAIHLDLAVLGWLTLLIVTVGRTLAPMLALAPAAARRRFPGTELALTAGLWLLVAGLAFGGRALVAAGGLVAFGAVATFAVLTARVSREHRLDGVEGPLLHLATGLFFLGQATLLGLALALGMKVTVPRLAAYVIALLLGWAAGVTLGHLGKLLSLSAWTWWPPGPRPKQAVLYPRRVWVIEAVAFAIGCELLLNGALVGSERTVQLGGVLLATSAALACLAALVTFRAGVPALARRASGGAPQPVP